MCESAHLGVRTHISLFVFQCGYKRQFLFVSVFTGVFVCVSVLNTRPQDFRANCKTFCISFQFQTSSSLGVGLFSINSM